MTLPILIRLPTVCLILLLAHPGWSYTSRSGHFSCPNPLENSLGGARIQEDAGMVSFVSNYGEVYRVEILTMDPQENSKVAKIGRMKYLEDILYGSYIPGIIQRAVPQAKGVTSSYVKNFRGGSFIAYIAMPNGASVEVDTYDLKNNTKQSGRPDTVRAVLAFLEKNLVVLVSSELAQPRFKAKDVNVEAELQKQVIDFARQVRITD